MNSQESRRVLISRLQLVGDGTVSGHVRTDRRGEARATPYPERERRRPEKLEFKNEKMVTGNESKAHILGATV